METAPAAATPWRTALFLTLGGAVTTLLLLYLLRPLGDLDFWWHLKTGEVMLGQKSLLRMDPFNYTGDVVVRGREAVILNGYWLWQITAAALYALLGLNGIFVLKFLTAGLLAAVLYAAMQREQLSPWTRAVLGPLALLVVVTVYNLERPQLFSFIFMTILLGMIARLRRGGPPSLLLLPLMVLWANIHGGFVVADIVLVLAAGGFCLQYRHDRHRCLRLVSWALAGVLASFVNPNGWTAVAVVFDFMQNSLGTLYVNEYRSTLQLFQGGLKTPAVIVWLLAALQLAGLLAAPRRYWPEIFITLFLLAFGLKYIRNTGFIAVSLLPVTGWYLEQACSRLGRAGAGFTRPVLVLLALAAVSTQARGEWQQRQTAAGPIAALFPVEMAEFLRTSGLKGNLFNEYGAGGYLDWALYPDWKTFIDGRELDTRVSRQYVKIATGSREPAEGRFSYELLLDRYRINVVAQRTALPDGRLQPLMKLLLVQPQWLPVYYDGKTFVLARDTGQNAAAISRHRLDKAAFLEAMTRSVTAQLGSQPGFVPALVMYADILTYSGQLAEAAPLISRLAGSGIPADTLAYLQEQYDQARRGSR